MSVESLIAFMHSLETDNELQRTLKSVESDAQVVDLATDKGFRFSVEEVRDAAARARMIAASNRELSDQDLASVAGGAANSFGMLRSFDPAVLGRALESLR